MPMLNSITEDLYLKADPCEILVVSDTFVKDEPPHSGGQLWLVCKASLAVQNNSDTSNHEIIARLKTKVSANRFSGVYTGEKIIVLKTYPSKVKEVEIESLDDHDQIFDFIEADAGSNKQFGLNHLGFKPKPNHANHNKFPVDHVIYDGSRILKIQLNNNITTRVTVRY